MRDFYIREEGYADAMRHTVLPYLQLRREEKSYPGYDGHEMHCVVYHADLARGSVIVSHGFTESSEKFHEIAYYLLRSGFHVYLPDHRGHGRSYRKLEDLTLTHIDHFDEYVKDFILLAKRIRKIARGPLCIYSHSMGGAIAMLALEEVQNLFDAAFLSSPMIVPSAGKIPTWVGRLIAGGAVLLGKKEKRAFVSKPYAGKEEFEDSSKTSRARFMEYEEIKRTTPCYQNACATYGWIYESLKVGRQILRSGAPERVKVPVFLAVAGKDTTVLEKPQRKLAARLPDCTLRVYPEAKHEIYGSTDDTAFPYFDDMLDFFEQT